MWGHKKDLVCTLFRPKSISNYALLDLDVSIEIKPWILKDIPGSLNNSFKIQY